MSSASDSPHAIHGPPKSSAAFRTISEVAGDLNVPQHVLRFWETKFNQIKPMKRGGGRRYYRPEDVELLRRIRSLLYQEGYTIRGVQKVLRDAGGRGLARSPLAREAASRTPSSALERVLAELLALKRDLANLSK
jgi:DNA-binding transcriptional MerR regulator